MRSQMVPLVVAMLVVGACGGKGTNEADAPDEAPPKCTAAMDSVVRVHPAALAAQATFDSTDAPSETDLDRMLSTLEASIEAERAMLADCESPEQWLAAAASKTMPEGAWTYADDLPRQLQETCSSESLVSGPTPACDGIE